MKHCPEYNVSLPKFFQQGDNCWGREIPQEVLVAVWGAKKAECQRATNSDAETEHRSQHATSDWTRSENADRERDGATAGASGILSENGEEDIMETKRRGRE